MQDGNTKMVSVAHALSEALGSDSEKYEEAMAKRLALESQESLPSDILSSLGLKDGHFPYITSKEVVFVGNQDHFDWTRRNGANPRVISEELALYYINKCGWELMFDEPMNPDVIKDIQEYREDEIRTAAVNDMRSMDLEDPWADWEDDWEDKRPIKRRERKDKRQTEKERTLQRKKQRERKIVYRSDDDDFPVYGYAEDWEDDALNGRR